MSAAASEEMELLLADYGETIGVFRGGDLNGRDDAKRRKLASSGGRAVDSVGRSRQQAATAGEDEEGEDDEEAQVAASLQLAYR
jgi:hypothetical protein